MAILATFIKQPADVLDYDIDYSDWLTEGDNVASVATAVSDDGLTISQTAVIDPIAKIWVTGGTAGETYKVTVTATTAEGRTKQDEFKIRVKEF